MSSYLDKYSDEICIQRAIYNTSCPTAGLVVLLGISLGSDSNVQINLLEDARELEYHLRLSKLSASYWRRSASSPALPKRVPEVSARPAEAWKWADQRTSLPSRWMIQAWLVGPPALTPRRS